MGYRPNLLGDFIPKPLLRFALAFKLIEAKQSQYENIMTKKKPLCHGQPYDRAVLIMRI